MWSLLIFGCGDPAPVLPPATTHGTLIHAGPETALVQHEDLRGRIAAGVERYRLTEPGALAGIGPGDHVDLWLTGEVLDRAVVTGRDALPDGFVAGGSPVVGTVVNVDGIRVTVDHEAVPGVMGAMVMGFGLAPWEASRFATGDRIEGRLLRSGYGIQLVDPVKTGSADASLRTDVAPLAPGDVLPRTELVAEDGSSLVLGAGQGVPTALTYIYTNCPDPSFCPAIAARLAALQPLVAGARIVTVTLDPDHDDLAALSAWGRAVGADPTIWRLARAEPVVLQELALRGGQHVTIDGGRISHLHRLLILDANGALIERYDDNLWPRERVAAQLLGAPVPSTP